MREKIKSKNIALEKDPNKEICTEDVKKPKHVRGVSKDVLEAIVIQKYLHFLSK